MATLLKHTPSTIKSNAGLGNTVEPTHFTATTGSRQTYLAWLNSTDQPTKKQTRKIKAIKILDDELSLED